MRTKKCTGVLRLDVILDPRVEIHLHYDGLAGLSQRGILRDIVEELRRKGEEELPALVAALRRHGGRVTLDFLDFASYGVGGGDAAGEWAYPRSMLLWLEPARDDAPEHLALRRNPVPVPVLELPPSEQQVERLRL